MLEGLARMVPLIGRLASGLVAAPALLHVQYGRTFALQASWYV